jgi:hypothetical protein
MLSIATPCSRPENLHAVRKSINFDKIDKWYIVHDTRSKPFKRVFMFEDCNSSQIVEVGCENPGVFGNPMRNFVLDSLALSGFVYFLDDDNCVHPSFWTTFDPLGKAVQSFDMIYEDTHVLEGCNFVVNNIDTSMCVFDVGFVPQHLRYEVEKYNADGVFLQALANHVSKTNIQYTKRVAAFYNKLKWST